MEKQEVKEVRELLVGVMELAVLIAERLKDGFQTDDVMHLFLKIQSDPVFVEAFKNLKEVPNEVKDLDVSESVELILVMLPYIPKLVDMLKK